MNSMMVCGSQDDPSQQAFARYKVGSISLPFPDAVIVHFE
jgi:hypothetical protein